MNKRNILLAITSMLLIIIIVIVLIYLSSYLRRVIIINDLKDKSKDYDNLTNYSYTLETTYGDIKLNGNSFKDNYSRNNNATKRMNVICNYGDIEIDTLKN